MLLLRNIAHLIATLTLLVHMMVPHQHQWELPQADGKAPSQVAMDCSPESPFAAADLGIKHLETFRSSSQFCFVLPSLPQPRLQEFEDSQQVFPAPVSQTLPQRLQYPDCHALRGPPCA
jgi:hypothetical protein